MASPASATPTGSAEPLYIIKITYDGATRKFKFPMTDLSVDVLPMKVCHPSFSPPRLSLVLHEKDGSGLPSYPATECQSNELC